MGECCVKCQWNGGAPDLGVLGRYSTDSVNLVPWVSHHYLEIENHLNNQACTKALQRYGNNAGLLHYWQPSVPSMLTLEILVMVWCGEEYQLVDKWIISNQSQPSLTNSRKLPPQRISSPSLSDKDEIQPDFFDDTGVRRLSFVSWSVICLTNTFQVKWDDDIAILRYFLWDVWAKLICLSNNLESLDKTWLSSCLHEREAANQIWQDFSPAVSGLSKQIGRGGMHRCFHFFGQGFGSRRREEVADENCTKTRCA